MKVKLMYRLSAICLLLLLGAFYGCAGREYAPNNGVWYYHKELPAADRAVEAARAAGKDRECPVEFAAAEKMKNDAYKIYWACRTAEGIAMANEATARANALCPRIAAVAPPPPPPLAAAPTVSIWADPATIEQGQCSTLAWSTTGASSASIDRGIGSMNPNGSRQVCPGGTTEYTATAMGEGGTRTASTTVTVNSPPPPPPVRREPKVIDRLVLHVNFDFDKSVVRPADVAELQKAIDFIKKYPANDISIEGHTDSRGTDKYNLALSDRRSAAVKAYLLKHAEIDARKDTITTKGFGESKPIADNKTDKGRFENRRVEILVLEK